MKVNFSAMTLSAHAKYDRAERFEKIATVIGWGQPVKESYKNGRYHFVTDTGIRIVTDEHKTVIITAYPISQRELVGIYGGKAPKQLRAKVCRNESMGFVRNW